MGRKIWEERRYDQKRYGSVEKQVSRPGHRLPARRGEHLACRFPRDSGQDARLPHSQDGCAPVADGFSTKSNNIKALILKQEVNGGLRP
jgi:hypothetical protein